MRQVLDFCSKEVPRTVSTYDSVFKCVCCSSARKLFCTTRGLLGMDNFSTDSLPEFEHHWARPENVEFPNVWHRFETRPKNGKTYKIRVEELTPERFEEVIDFMMKYYFTEEPLSVSSKLLEDELSISIYQFVLMQALSQGISIIAVLDDDTPKPPIIGLQILTVASKDDPPLPEVPGEAIQKFRRVYYDIRLKVNPYEILNSDTHLHDWGLCVDPAFRGINVGYNILASLEHIMKTFKLSGALIMFTRTESQVLATRLGYQVYYELVYSDYKDENGEVIFPIKDHKSLKFMGIKNV